ncbi:signal peptidase I [Cohnella sp. GCM10027633]|uniref:signal peptidase I n=1 Tax=unclassified Cohnella TaxID=2636738 RepID=UPI0036353EDB
MLAELGYDHPHPFRLGSEVLVDMNEYASNYVSRGDIVVFQTKNNKDQETDIARVVGLPGETIRIEKGQVYIDDKKLDVFYGGDSTINNNDSWKAVDLKENEYYILADVRWRGFNDSQTGGPFAKDDILGKVVGYERSE